MGNNSVKEEVKDVESNNVQHGIVDVNAPIHISGSFLLYLVLLIAIIAIIFYVWRRNRCGLNSHERQIRNVRKLHKHRLAEHLLEAQIRAYPQQLQISYQPKSAYSPATTISEIINENNESAPKENSKNFSWET